MGTLHIHNVDDTAVMRYNSAATDEKEKMRQISAFGQTAIQKRLKNSLKNADRQSRKKYSVRHWRMLTTTLFFLSTGRKTDSPVRR